MLLLFVDGTERGIVVVSSVDSCVTGFSMYPGNLAASSSLSGERDMFVLLPFMGDSVWFFLCSVAGSWFSLLASCCCGCNCGLLWLRSVSRRVFSVSSKKEKLLIGCALFKGEGVPDNWFLRGLCLLVGVPCCLRGDPELDLDPDLELAGPRDPLLLLSPFVNMFAVLLLVLMFLPDSTDLLLIGELISYSCVWGDVSSDE